MLQAIAGHDPKDPTTGRVPVPDYSEALVPDIDGLKIGVPRHYFFSDDPNINSETLAVVEDGLKAFESLGAHVEEVSVPSLTHNSAAHIVILLGEAFAYHQRNLRAIPDKFGDMVRARFTVGGLFASGDYVQAQRLRNVLKREVAQVLQRVDVIVTPTTSTPAVRFDEADVMTTARSPSFTSPFNMTGLPAISVPCGFTSNGLPVGLQIVGPPFDEPGVLRAAYAFEQQSGLAGKRPPM
jgi:aspartyl-tRNA(Asn)/glutamyl-tRNA(Gln) amidotransferase subunit A